VWFGRDAQRSYGLTPDHVVGQTERLAIGGVHLVLHPLNGGETSDALLVELPAREHIRVEIPPVLDAALRDFHQVVVARASETVTR
jgi:hypothetical protein